MSSKRYVEALSALSAISVINYLNGYVGLFCSCAMLQILHPYCVVVFLFSVPVNIGGSFLSKPQLTQSNRL